MLNGVPAVCGLLIVANAKWSTVVLATTVNVIGFPVPAANEPPDAPIVTEPAVAPETVMFATPPTALTEPTPVTLPVPVVFPNVTLNVLSAPVVIGLPALSLILPALVPVGPP